MVSGETMNGYEPLRRYLQAQGDEQVTLSFSDIADIIGDSLPESAHRQTAWWANDPEHPEAQAWMGAGYDVAFMSLASETVTFVRVSAPLS
jgi:hypothetical protein